MQIFCGNFEYDAREREIVHLFEKYGQVERIDMKTGEPQVAVNPASAYHTAETELGASVTTMGKGL